MSYIYNWHTKKFVILAAGQEYCNECEGKGIIRFKKIKIPNDPASKPLICSKCYGEGILDWIEKAMGKKRTGAPLPPSPRFVRGI